MGNLAIIQARMGSQRLPGKMMLKLAGKPVLQLVIERLKNSRLIDTLVLATSTNKENDILAELAASCCIDTFRGEEHKVFTRFRDCVKNYPGATYVSRICADNPLISPEVTDFLIEDHIHSTADYSCITPAQGWPDGVGGEVINAEVFERIQAKSLTADEQEHCLKYIWNNPHEFHMNLPRIENFIAPPSYEKIKLDLDTPKDYERLCCFLDGLSFEESVSLTVADIIKRYHTIFEV